MAVPKRFCKKRRQSKVFLGGVFSNIRFFCFVCSKFHKKIGC